MGMRKGETNRGSFQKGNEGKPIGAVSKKTIVKRAIMNNEQVKNYIDEVMIPTLIANIETLEGRDYVVAGLGLLEYYKPKLARKEVVTETKKPIINIIGKNRPMPVNVPRRTDTNEHIETIDEID
jgi:hypothetical protein